MYPALLELGVQWETRGIGQSADESITLMKEDGTYVTVRSLGLPRKDDMWSPDRLLGRSQVTGEEGRGREEGSAERGACGEALRQVLDGLKEFTMPS